MHIRVDAGLGNRLETLFSFLTPCKLRGEQIILQWLVNSDCNGEFSDGFEPIDGVDIVHPSEPTESSVQKWVCLKPNDLDSQSCMRYNLKPSSKIMDSVRAWQEKIGTYAAMHVRRTDFVPHMQQWNVDIKPYDDFDSFVGEHQGTIFLATDNDETQQYFRNKYGERIVFNPIQYSSSSLRQTSLTQAIVDMFVCVGADDFIGTRGSSFSKMIHILRNEYDKATATETSTRARVHCVP